MKLPLTAPLKPQLARSAKEIPTGDDWQYEPKWDGFRTIAFRDGDEVFLQSRNGRPLNRYFPEVVEAVLKLKEKRFVLDGELIIILPEGLAEFDLLSQRIHPAESRVERLSKETPATLVAFDLLARGGKKLLDLSANERRKQLEKIVSKPIELTPRTSDPEEARRWLQAKGEGVVAKEGSAPYLPGKRLGMLKIKRVRTADAVVAAFRYGKEKGTPGSLILGLYNDGELQIVGHVSGFSRKEKTEYLELLEPYRTHERGGGPPSRWKTSKDSAWEGLRPELVVEIAFDHVSSERIRHGARLLRWRTDKDAEECVLDQLYA